MKLNDDMKHFVTNQLAYIATVDEAGQPNIGPKRTMRLLDDETLVYNENTGGQHFHNLKANGKVAVAYADWEAVTGYRFVGHATVHTSGPLFEEAQKLPVVPKAVVTIKVEDIYYLDSGPKAGKKVEA